MLESDLPGRMAHLTEQLLMVSSFEVNAPKLKATVGATNVRHQYRVAPGLHRLRSLRKDRHTPAMTMTVANECKGAKVDAAPQTSPQWTSS